MTSRQSKGTIQFNKQCQAKNAREMATFFMEKNMRFASVISKNLFKNVFLSRQATTAGAAASAMVKSRGGILLPSYFLLLLGTLCRTVGNC